MTRRALLTLVASGLLWLAIAPAPTWAGGGGCHSGMTQGTGEAVLIQDGCFTPAILHVEPGATVSFSNRDPWAHNVSANGWGHLDEIGEGDGFAAAFDVPGIYPFACTYHPGMTGAVVVGDGGGAGNGTQVTVGSLVAPEEPSVEPIVARSTTERGGLGWVGGTALGLVAGTGIGLAASRRLRSTV